MLIREQTSKIPRANLQDLPGDVEAVFWTSASFLQGSG